MYLEMTSKFCNNFMVNLNLEEKYFESILYNVENVVKEFGKEAIFKFVLANAYSPIVVKLLKVLSVVKNLTCGFL